MRKKDVDVDQEKILQNYNIRTYTNSKGETKTKTSLKSNVMFLERYHDLLDEDGVLITIIDESVLNTDTDKPFRDWMLRNYQLKAVISLPQNAFSDAGSNVKTSILYLVKKAEPSDDQPFTFYARSENIGFDKLMKLDETMSDLKQIRDAYFKFKETGRVPNSTTRKKERNEKTRYYSLKLSKGVRRIDFEWHDPRHLEMAKRLDRISKEKKCALRTIGDLVKEGVCKIIKGKTADHYVSEGIPIIKLRNVTNEGIDWDTDFILKAFYDSLPDSHLKQKDILITTTGVGTIGRVAVLGSDAKDCITDGHVAAIRILDQKKLHYGYLAHYLRSVFGQMQMERFTVGSTGQTELNDTDIELMQEIYPESIEEQAKILKRAQSYEESALLSREDYLKKLEMAREEFLRELETKVTGL